jgi:hypothetical protein
MRYNPFEKEIAEIGCADLARLRSVAEGWYVEYKSQKVQVKNLAKSLSGFANQYGGWLLIGVEEAPDGSRVASAFPGVPAEDVSVIESALRDASRDCIRPSVFYEHRVVTGPAPEIGLPSGRSVIVVTVPMGVDAPYIHSDGRVYRRVSDSSAPVAEHDRHVLDSLWLRGEAARGRLVKLATRLPLVSKAEGENPFLHLFISADPLEQSGRGYLSDWATARMVMKGDPVPFDNIYARSGGFVARQARGNSHPLRLFTWEFYQEGHSFVTLPMAFFDFGRRIGALQRWLSGYEQAGSFVTALTDAGVTAGRIVDLNFLFLMAGGIGARHRALLRQDAVRGPFYAKAQLQNVWRCIPFLDLASFVDQLTEDGVPVVQESEILCPPGDDLESFRVLPPSEREDGLSLNELVGDGLALSVPVLLALGVSPATIAKGGGQIALTADRAKLAQRYRNETGGLARP